MKEWNVYVAGRYVGTVSASTEAEARLAALSDYDIDDEASLSVSLRSSHRGWGDGYPL